MRNKREKVDILSVDPRVVELRITRLIAELDAARKIRDALRIKAKREQSIREHAQSVGLEVAS